MPVRYFEWFIRGRSCLRPPNSVCVCVCLYSNQSNPSSTTHTLSREVCHPIVGRVFPLWTGNAIIFLQWEANEAAGDEFHVGECECRPVTVEAYCSVWQCNQVKREVYCDGDCYIESNTDAILCECVCICVFFPFILDIKFVGRTSRDHTGGRSHMIFHPPSFCGACLNFFREKDSAITFPRRP